MVPSEGETLVVKRKPEDHEAPERRRKKKKKKNEIATTRPPCSWVYFNRDFIKEYRASHPESSGLKAATKAASDAWKSMSLEEKAKYTQHAREVWDNYLSTSPARPLKPRKQTKLVTRCSPGRLFNVLQRLTPEQKEAVKSLGFGNLLGLRCRTLRRSLCLWLLERFNTAQCSLEICGEHVLLCPADVELVMGLSASGKDVVNSGPDELIADLRHYYNATNHGISVRLLEERLAAPDAGEDFKRSFVLYTLGTLLSPTARLDASPSFLHFLTNMGVVHQYNWGKFLLDRLVREVSRYRQGKQRAVGGCLLFLQLFYYESVSIEEPGVLDRDDIPCLSWWGEEEISEREKREKQLGGYGFGEVICKGKCLGAESRENGDQLDGLTNGPLIDQEVTKAQAPLRSENVVCGDIEVIVQSVRSLSPCRNKDYGCNETVDVLKTLDHEESCVFSPCSCPLLQCNFIGSSEQLSLHFSSNHWDYGRRFRYNSPLSVSLAMNEQFLVLQAEDDGVLFLLNKSIERIGHTVMVTCIRPSISKRKCLYDLVVGKGISTLRLKSQTENYPGRVEGFPPTDFLLVPFRFCVSSGLLDLEWKSIVTREEDIVCASPTRDSQ